MNLNNEWYVITENFTAFARSIASTFVQIVVIQRPKCYKHLVKLFTCFYFSPVDHEHCCLICLYNFPISVHIYIGDHALSFVACNTFHICVRSRQNDAHVGSCMFLI